LIYARAAQSPEYYLSPDCPTTDGKLEARWGGKGSKLLCLGDEFGTLSFLRLAKGLNPETGSQLTARLSSNRKEATDLSVTVPKSVSVLIEVERDQRVKDALWEANNFVINRWEKKVKVRERKGGVYKDRPSGNITVASFYHGTGRPVSENGNYPDPNSHIHNYVMNVSYDSKEGIWKAMKRIHYDLPGIQKQFHKRLAKNLNKIGYETRATPDAFEVKGIAREELALFSGRQDEIRGDQKIRAEKGQKMTEGYKARTSQMVRQSKSSAPEMTTAELRDNWKQRLPEASTVHRAVAKARVAASRSRWLGRLKNHITKLRSFTSLRETEARETVRTRSNGRSR